MDRFCWMCEVQLEEQEVQYCIHCELAMLIQIAEMEESEA